MAGRSIRALALGAVGVLASLGLAAAQDHSHGPVTLPSEIVTAASGFQAYMEHAADVRSDFHDGEAVHRALRVGVTYQHDQLEEGMIAYGALVALQDSHFINAVAAAGRKPEDRQALAERIEANPAEALRFDGSSQTARLVAMSLTALANPVAAAGRSVKQSAYDIQHEAWSKGKVPNLAGRLKEVKTLSMASFVATPSDNAHLMSAMLRLPQPDTASPPVSPIVARALGLAAVAVLGQARPEDMPKLGPLLTEYYSADCLKMAKLNLYQCMAVAVPNYENVFCLGQHALIDTGQCVASAVTASPNRFAPPYQPPMATATPVKVPVKPAHHHRRRS